MCHDVTDQVNVDPLVYKLLAVYCCGFYFVMLREIEV